MLQEKYPRAKFIFVLRKPKSMLASYKNIYKHEVNTNTRWRYHPVLQSLAWQASARTFLEKSPEKFLLVRYEDLVKQTDSTIGEVSKFLQVDFPTLDLRDFSNNSSYNNNDYSDLTDTEVWLGEKIVAREMARLGCQSSNCRFRIRDIGTMTLISLKVFIYYLSKIVTSADIRIRVLKLLRKLISK